MYILQCIITTLFSLSQSRKFIPYGFPEGGDGESPVTFEIDIGPETTTISIYLHEGNQWFGIGFGGTTMNTTDYAVVITGEYPYTITDRKLNGTGPGIVLSTNLWEDTEFNFDGLSEDPPEPAILRITRDNDVSATCPDCYTFDPDMNETGIILAKGTSSTYGYHGDGNNKRGEIVTAIPLTSDPTEMPTYQPTVDPTQQPTLMPTFIDCVYSDDIIDGVTLRIRNDEKNQRMGIVIEADYDGTDYWFAYGFGKRQMNGTYAIIGGIDGQDIMERIMGASDTDEREGYEIDEDGTYGYGDDFVYDYEIVDDRTILTVIRPYTDHLSYDFYRFMTCRRTWIGVIAAKGDGTDEWGYHGENNRGSAIIHNECCVLPSTTMYAESTMIMIDTTETVEETEVVVDEMTTMIEDLTTTEQMSLGVVMNVQSVVVFMAVVVGLIVI